MRVLRLPGFAPLLAGQAVNAIGNWVAIIAVWGFATFRFDAGAGDLALLFVVLSIPGALLGPLLGVVIDRMGPRRALVVANVAGAVFALALTQAGSYTSVIVLALPLGLIEALASASLDALPPRLITAEEDLVTANALLGGAEDLAIVVGPLVAAAVNVRWGMSGAFVVDAATFVVGAVVALGVDAPPVRESETSTTPWGELREGLRLVRATPGLRWTLGVVTCTYALWGLFGVLEPLYVRDVLGESDTTFALFQTVFGLGLVGAGLVVAALGDRVARPPVVALATVASGGAAALYLGTEHRVVAFAGVACWGVAVALFYTPAKTLLQRYAPVAAHGRILALNQTLEPLTDLVMTPAAAASVGLVGVQALGLVGGAAAGLAGVVALGWSRRLGPPPPPGPVDPTAGTPRDAVALGGPAPG